MNYVKNLRQKRVKYFLSGFGVTDVTLGKDQVNPAVGFYLTQTTLLKAKCLPDAQSSPALPSTPLALAQALKAAGKTANHIASQMKSTLNATASQVGSALKVAGFSANQIASAVRSAFSNSATSVGQALKAAGYTKNQTIGALRTAFNSSASKVAEGLKAAGYALNDIAGVLKNNLDLTRQQAETALRQARFTVAEIRRVLDRLYRQAARTVRKQIDTQRTANSRAMASSMKIDSVLHDSRYILNSMQCSSPSSTQYGASGFPVPLPNNMRQPLTVTIKGENLSSATSISGLPRGVKASIIARGNCGIRVSISVPSSVRFGSRGIAVLKAGRQNSGARFHYSIRPIPRSTSENRTYMELFTPRVANRATRNRTSNTNTVDLRPMRLAVNLYKVGSATTADGLGNTYTALNPFDNSAFCQGIQEGGLLTTQTTYYTQPGTYCVTWFQRATGAMTVDTTASCVGVVNELGTTTQVARRVTITVPNIVWGVENNSNTDVSYAFTIQLKRGGTVVATQTVNSLARGQVSTFSYARPQSQTTVAKVGLGAGCYHTGLSSAGWNDNPGYSVHVDIGNDVSESHENNNVRQL